VGGADAVVVGGEEWVDRGRGASRGMGVGVRSVSSEEMDGGPPKGDRAPILSGLTVSEVSGSWTANSGHSSSSSSSSKSCMGVALPFGKTLFLRIPTG